MTSEIIWTGSPDDHTAVVGEYRLRYFKVNELCYWWCVFHKNYQFAACSNFEYTIEQAKTACEKAYREHLNKK